MTTSVRHARVHDVSTPSRAAGDVDVAALEARLRANLRGEVRFTDGDRALYATDASNYRQTPIGVVIPRDVDDVVTTIAIARELHAPVLPRGCGTSLAGQCCNVAVVLDFTKYMHQVLDVDAELRLARARPGAILDSVRDAARAHGLTFGPDPATHDHCTIGGMIGNNSCGVHSVMASFAGTGARTSDNIRELDIVTYDGHRMRVGPTSEEDLQRIILAGGRRAEIYARLKRLRDRYGDLIRERYPHIPRRVSGYNLDELLPENGFNVARALAGSEGTCVTILEATLELIPEPPVRSLLVLGYPDVFAAGAHVPTVLRYRPIACEGIDDQLVHYMERKGLHARDVQILPEGNGWLLVEFGGSTREEADQFAHDLMDELRRAPDAPSMKLFDDPDEEHVIWAVRESGLGATAFVPQLPDTWPGWEDSAVHPDHLAGYLRDLRALFDKYGYQAALYGHFGQGCVHCRIPFDLVTHEGVANFRAFMEEASDLVLRYGGSLSGEHGDGQARAELLPKMFGEELMGAFREFKSLWDPEWRMNPGKVVSPYPLDSNLRIGTEYHPASPETHFHFPADRGDFSRAALRCVGVGECRRVGGGTMCPSYMVTREEKHSTRGRARLLFEMLRGETITDGWQSEAVKDALDLCLSCKGCKSDCPLNVDMATYKAEFLSHYYDEHRRPRSAYAFGLIPLWARAASHAPGLVNFLTQTPGLRSVAKAVAGIAPERGIPRFAATTFRERFGAQRENRTGGSAASGAAPSARRDGNPDVLLWTDTFNNHFHPDTLGAAVDVLEDAGFHVRVPAATLCCGRPLYDYGMLDRARSWLQHTVRALRSDIEAGTPVVVLEPSCAAVFRDELLNLLPHDADAQRLSAQTFLLSELLAEHAPHYRPPTLHRKAVVHGHCHHTSVMKFTAEQEVLDAMGLDYELPPSGCCGMAGGFGFEREHYDVSVRCGERVLLPAVRAAGRDTLIIADGFSCREQIAQGTGRRALHLADVLQLAIRERRVHEREATGAGPTRREVAGAPAGGGAPRASRPRPERGEPLRRTRRHVQRGELQSFEASPPRRRHEASEGSPAAMREPRPRDGRSEDR
ncbi:MAG TPA: FAD-binding and (Fe-S)-binding domain-containing protein [Gemmatimonadaceae bacterium]|nr:FAD-binding and (Fe-S)-binding domain-containing protein [Gemmatimonadaceae bacterium]